MYKIIKNEKYDLERSLYNLIDTEVVDCIFKGTNDGESVLKETRNCIIKNCDFSLRYPLWHAKDFKLINSRMDELTRAPIWYADKGIIDNTTIKGIKSVRECNNIQISNSTILSNEFGWMSKNISIDNSNIVSEYFFLKTDNVKVNKVNLEGKYSFQYMNNLEINDSNLNTKDAFWHSNNVVVKNSNIKGEYLGWFSNNVTFINCNISGTQPLCYCTNLKLINCTMDGCDLAFEYSDVDADIIGNIYSIKNPKSGLIRVESVNEVITDHTVMECNGKIEIKKR